MLPGFLIRPLFSLGLQGLSLADARPSTAGGGPQLWHHCSLPFPTRILQTFSLERNFSLNDAPTVPADRQCSSAELPSPPHSIFQGYTQRPAGSSRKSAGKETQVGNTPHTYSANIHLQCKGEQGHQMNCWTTLRDPWTPGSKGAAVTTQGDKGQIPTCPHCRAGGTCIYTCEFPLTQSVIQSLCRDFQWVVRGWIYAASPPQEEALLPSFSIPCQTAIKATGISPLL